MGVWNRIKSWFVKEPKQLWHKKIASVRGENPPGMLVVDLCVYDEKDEPVGAPSERVCIPIPSSFRPTVNRILAGTESQADRDALEELVKSKI